MLVRDFRGLFGVARLAGLPLTIETGKGSFVNIRLHIPLGWRGEGRQAGQGAWGVCTPTG